MISVDAWRARGRTVETLDGRVFAVRVGEGSATPVLVLHGFPTSSWDFARIAETLGAKRPVVLFDFLGFGFSAKPEKFSYSLIEQADVALTVARSFGLERVHLWAHDMGTSVATELLARRERGGIPLTLASLTLMNGSVHQELAHITPSQRLLKTPLGPLFARLSNRRSFVAQMKKIFGRPVPDAELDGMWELVARDNGALRLPAIAGYMAERKRFERRWIGALERLDLPTLVAWGRRDPVAVPAIAEQLASEIPRSRAVWWESLGHYPQVEEPDTVARTVESFWSDLD